LEIAKVFFSKKQRTSEGFTLIEVLVTTAIFIVIVTIGTNSFMTIMRNAAKTKVISLIKLEGNYSLSAMERMIRNARQVMSCGSDAVTIENPDHNLTTFRFCGNPDNLIASQSGSLTCSQARLTSDQTVLESGAFTCSPPATELTPYVVGISFTLRQAGTSTRVEDLAAIDFQTTVSLRNLP
jgi:prepilin-type N-terminal cleavage/methylation domain-containing protein